MDKNWLVFSNFFYDIKEILEKYKLIDEFISGSLHIDKDILQEDIPANKRIYSKNTISFVTKEENNKHRDTDRIALKNSNYFISKMHGIETLQQNIRKFGRENGIDSRRICESIKYQKPLRHTNYQFRYPTKNELILIDEGKLVPGDVIN